MVDNMDEPGVYVVLVKRLDDGFWCSSEEADELSDEELIKLLDEDPIHIFREASKEIIRIPVIGITLSEAFRMLYNQLKPKPTVAEGTVDTR